ncbi:hypothetical protein [Levilactobacillus brevis]|uniref:hypothetical protein n=1 Tax=Levilactobacillus brevis TaxID=1580 RepID=UPI0011187E44|nr:hypothetical protein [Levilactobacillus brevis]QCZ42409.1 hypothetical protein UCCLBBS124_0047 [Levilactobacillus brevis]
MQKPNLLPVVSNQFQLTLNLLVSYRNGHGGNHAFGAYGLRLATYYFIRVQGVVSRQQVLAVVKAAGYTEQVAASAISNAISRKRRQRRLIPVSGRNRPAYYRMFPGFLWENIRIY